MLPNQIIFIFKIFDCFGFFTEYKSSVFWKRFRYAFSFFVLIYISIVRVDILSYVNIISVIELVNGSIQYFGALLTFYVEFFESLLTRHLSRAFWKKNEANDCRACHKWSSYLIKFWLHLLLLIMYLLFVFLETEPEARVLTTTITTLMRFYQFRIFHYLTHIRVIRNNITTIHMHAKEASIFLGASSIGYLKHIRHLYRNTFEMVNYLNEMFGYSQFTLVLYCYFLLLTECNWYYIYVDEYEGFENICKLVIHPGMEVYETIFSIFLCHCRCHILDYFYHFWHL